MRNWSETPVRHRCGTSRAPRNDPIVGVALAGIEEVLPRHVVREVHRPRGVGAGLAGAAVDLRARGGGLDARGVFADPQPVRAGGRVDRRSRRLKYTTSPRRSGVAAGRADTSGAHATPPSPLPPPHVGQRAVSRPLARSSAHPSRREVARAARPHRVDPRVERGAVLRVGGGRDAAALDHQAVDARRRRADVIGRGAAPGGRRRWSSAARAWAAPWKLLSAIA